MVGASKSSPLLEEAREIGRFEAEAFDRRLRDLEQSERAEILEQIVSVGLPRGSEDPVVQNIRHHDAVRLQRDLDRLSEFHRTLVTSRSWRLLQLLRRPFGRAW